MSTNTEDRKFYVYVHMKATDDAVFYVGKGCGSRYKKTQGRNQYWQRVVAKYGFVAEIVKSNLTFEEANTVEIELIKQLREQGCELCNLTDGGEGTKGWKKTPEQIAHHKAVTTGLKRSEESKAKMRGRTFSEEALKRIGAAHKGKVVSEEAKRKMSEAKKGRTLSDEHKAKIGAVHKGNTYKKGVVVSEETKRKTSESLKKTLAAKKAMRQLLATVSTLEDAKNAG